MELRSRFFIREQHGSEHAEIHLWDTSQNVLLLVYGPWCNNPSVNNYIMLHNRLHHWCITCNERFYQAGILLNIHIAKMQRADLDLNLFSLVLSWLLTSALTLHELKHGDNAAVSPHVTFEGLCPGQTPTKVLL